jgi:histidinol dehydrogenase
MRVYDYNESSPEQKADLLARGGAKMLDDELQAQVDGLVQDVRERGDAATLDALEKFDGVRLGSPEDQRVSEEEFEAAREQTGGPLLRAIGESIAAVRAYSERAMQDLDWTQEISPGLVVGERHTPVTSAGLYVPSGKGSFPSVLVQIGTPAVVAAVPEVAVVVPPLGGGGGKVDPSVLIVADELGLRGKVFRTNGVAGVAALAFGTETIPKVRLVVGPGSPPVSAAQVLVQRYGVVTQMVLGPSESLILADNSADPRLIAADLLNEAEHGPDSSSVLVTWSRELVKAVQEELPALLDNLPEWRREFARSSITERGGAVIVEDLEEALAFTDEFAPEHMIVACEDSWGVAERVKNAGEILVGHDTPVSAANFATGSPAALPTNGFAKISSPVTVKSFLKFCSLASLSAEGLRRVQDTVTELADHEGFPAHRQSLEVRLRGAALAR